MKRFEIAVDITAAPPQVWDVMRDLERWPEWTASMTRVTRVDAGPLGVGSRVRVKQPKLAVADFEITAWEPARGFDWVATNPAVTAVATHAISPTPEGSRVTLAVEFRGPLAAVVSWLYGGLTTRYISMEAAGLKRRCEGLGG